MQKLITFGKCDLVLGTWKLRSHMRERTELSSNIEFERP